MLTSAFAGNINPPKNFHNLAGFSRRSSSSLQIGPSDLFVKILWLEQQNNTLIIISLDTLYFPIEIANIIDQYCFENFQINKNNILYNATHTHSAPSIALEHFGEINKDYVDLIVKEIKKGIDNCSQNKSRAEIEIRSFPAGNKIIGRRKIGRDIKSFFIKKKMLLLPNENQEIDDEIRTIQFKATNGACLATIINLSCHPVIANTNNYSADFPGQIEEKVSNSFGGTTLFLQGFCGDIRPNLTTSSTSPLDLVRYLKLFFHKKVFKLADGNDFKKFCDDIITRIFSAHVEKVDTAKFDTITSRAFEHRLESQTQKTIKLFKTKLIKLGDTIIVSIPAEVNSKYFVKLKNHFLNYKIVPLGYAEDMLGYLPFHEEIPEGGYEVNSATNYGWDSPLSIASTHNYYYRLVKELNLLLQDDLPTQADKNKMV